VLCPSCSTSVIAGARFCPQCGRRLEVVADGMQAGDRRVVTALFADLVGYTRLVDELDPEEVRARVDAALGAMGQVAVKFGGSLEKFIGDALLAVFGAPTAHDDDALRACLCGLEMEAALRCLGEGRPDPLEVRIGIATGEVVAALREVAGSRSIALTGGPMTTAARLQQLAKPAEILIDEVTRSAAEPRIGSERAGERLLRGQSKPVAVHRLRGVNRIVRPNCRSGVPLIGRDRERARLAAVLRATAAGGPGGAVLLRGEAGIGKSRLLAEMEDEARAAGLAWAWIDNAPYGIDSPYRAVRGLVEWLADEKGVKAGVLARQVLFGPDLDEATGRSMARAVAALARDSEISLLPEEGWEPAAEALSDPAEVQAGLRLVAHRWINRMVAEQPRCIVIDDCHWVDPSSRLLVGEMIGMTAELPLVVLAGSRPEAVPDWADLPDVEVIDLGGLDEVATRELGRAVGGADLEPDSARWLYRRTAGNPLFLGEIMRTLKEGGQLERVEGRLRIDDDAAQRSLPVSLRALLGARIDALPEAVRETLEVASVIGTAFPEWLLCELHPVPEVVRDLGQLAEAGILNRLDDAAGAGSTRWQFRHQLFHDAAYRRLLAERRRRLHSALADRLELVEPPVAAAELARHRVGAGEVARALPLLELAASEAVAVGAEAEAEAFMRAAAALRSGSGPAPGGNGGHDQAGGEAAG
jgi:adenylate cyclase